MGNRRLFFLLRQREGKAQNETEPLPESGSVPDGED
jgi:hypothetical protein